MARAAQGIAPIRARKFTYPPLSDADPPLCHAPPFLSGALYAEASSINFRRSLVYGLGVVWTSVLYRAWRLGLARPRLFSASPTLRLGRDYYARPRDGVRAAGHGDAG